ncbi:Hsp90 cochaperone [Coemansia spiralis]|nr:Hsp90 cochaperone [Coemansia spiralis]
MSTADELKAKGNAAFAAGNHEEAITHFSAAAELDPTNHVLYSNRSASLASLRRYAEALADAEKTVELKPDWAKGYSRKGAALYGLRRFEDAVATYEAGLKHDPSNALLKKGLADTEAALSSGPSDEDMSGFANKMSSAFQGDVLGKLAANPKTAPFLADQAFVAKVREIQANPDKLQEYADDQRITIAMFTLMGMGDIFTQGGPAGSPPPRPAPAAAAAKEEEEEPVELTEEDKEAAAIKSQAEEAKTQGNAAYKARRFDEALESYSKAIELNGTDITYWNNKAAVYFEMGRLDECIETAEKAVEVGRESRAEYKHIAKALGRIGTAYSKKDDLDAAIRYYGQSLAEHRTADVLSKMRALEKQRKERAEEAYHDKDKAEEARERGNALFKGGKFAEAQAEYSEAIKRNPGDVRNYSNRAACLTKLIAIPDALKDCEMCIKLDPTFVKAYIRKCNALFLKRDYAEALDALEEAKTQDKDKKNTAEINQLEAKCYNAISEHTARLSPEEALQRAQADPKIASVLANPAMQNILQQMQADPRAAREHLKNPAVASNLRKLIAAGIVRMG